mgnify:FL=1
MKNLSKKELLAMIEDAYVIIKALEKHAEDKHLKKRIELFCKPIDKQKWLDNIRADFYAQSTI